LGEKVAGNNRPNRNALLGSNRPLSGNRPQNSEKSHFQTHFRTGEMAHQTVIPGETRKKKAQKEANPCRQSLSQPGG
jgi:hypothetical protein